MKSGRDGKVLSIQFLVLLSYCSYLLFLRRVQVTVTIGNVVFKLNPDYIREVGPIQVSN